MSVIRLADEADRAFVVDSWLRSFRDAHAAGLIRMSRWKEVMRPEIEALLSRPGCVTKVMGHPERDGATDLIGWAAGEPTVQVMGKDSKLRADGPLLHMVYVKDIYRGMGHAKKLLEALGIDPTRRFLYTTKTAAATKTSDSYCSLFDFGRWNPIPARF